MRCDLQRTGTTATRLVFPAMAFAASISLLAACTSLATHIVNTEIDVQITGLDAAGRVWRNAPEEIFKTVHNPQYAYPFADKIYKGKLFDWRVAAAPKSLDGGITSHVKDLCLRFDQARFTSNFQSREMPMRMAVVRETTPKIPTQLELLPGDNPYMANRSHCFDREKPEAFGITVDMSALFPSGNMFNIKWEGKSTTLTNKGVGNWLKIHLPIEYEGKREELEITLTLTDSVARLVYL